MRTIVITLIPFVCALAQNLLVNGDFEQDISVGWTKDTSGYSIYIDRATDYEPDPDYELRVEKQTSSGYARVKQIVDIPSVNNITFSVKAKLYAYDNNADTLTFAAAAVIIGYRNSSGVLLGETRICQFTAPCPWQNTPTCHLIMVNDSLWHTHSFSLSSELQNLPGVNPANVQKIEIAFYDTTAHTC
ncbi:MAG: hypothetical protein ABIL39_05485 [candidate division WOR-3 bacterium]